MRVHLQRHRRSRKRTLHLALAAALVCLSVAGAASAQPASDNPSPLPGVFGEIVEVRVVNIEVVVTDERGVPISGLVPEDFRLIVDGEEVPIDYFSEIKGGVASSPRPTETAAVGVPSVVPGDPVGTSYLVFVDDFFPLARDRNKVLDALRRDIAELGPNDRMAIVAFDGDRLEMLTTWSSSPEHLTEVLTVAQERKAHGLQRLAERRQSRDDLLVQASAANVFGDNTAAFDSFSDRLTPFERAYIRRLTGQISNAVAAATATLRSFANPPGRKVMMLLSGGWPYLPAEAIVDRRVPGADGFDVDRFNYIFLETDGPTGPALYRPLTDAANLLGYTLYPIDVPSMLQSYSDLTDTAGRTTPSHAFDRGFEQELGLHDALRFMAKETGGQALLNSQRLETFPRVAQDTSSYYWLGFTPDRQWDDRRHDVRVEIDGIGFRVRSRANYLDSSRSREATMAVESALLFGNAPSDKPIPIRVGESRRSGRRFMEVPLTLLIPLDDVVVLPIGDQWVTELEIRVAVEDEDGRRSEIPIIPVRLALDTEPQGKGYARYETTLRLRRERHEAIIALFDPAGGTMLASRVDILP